MLCPAGEPPPPAKCQEEEGLFCWAILAALLLLATLGQLGHGTYPLMLAGMFFFLRHRLQRRDAAMVGSLAFTFSSFNLLHLASPDAIFTVALIPWILWAIDIVLVDAPRKKVAAAQAALVLLTASQLLLGCLSYVWFSLIAEAALIVYLLTTRRRAAREGCELLSTCTECIGCKRSTAPRVIVAKVLGSLLGCVPLTPTLHALIHGAPPTCGIAGRLEVLHPISLTRLVAPYVSIDGALEGTAQGMGLYVGAVPLMLAVWVFMRQRDLGPLRPLAWTAGALAALGILTSMEGYAQVYLLQHGLPSADTFQFSCRSTILFQFAVAVLAAIGFTVLQRESQPEPSPNFSVPELPAKSRIEILWKRFEALWAVVLVGMAIALVGVICHSEDLVATLPRILIGPLLLATAAVLMIASARQIRGALVALILFAAADLGYYGLSCTRADTNPSVGSELPLAGPIQFDERPRRSHDAET